MIFVHLSSGYFLLLSFTQLKYIMEKSRFTQAHQPTNISSWTMELCDPYAVRISCPKPPGIRCRKFSTSTWPHGERSSVLLRWKSGFCNLWFEAFCINLWHKRQPTNFESLCLRPWFYPDSISSWSYRSREMFFNLLLTAFDAVIHWWSYHTSCFVSNHWINDLWWNRTGNTSALDLHLTLTSLKKRRTPKRWHFSSTCTGDCPRRREMSSLGFCHDVFIGRIDSRS